MTIIESLTLGTVQGITEFIPVSSSGHLVLAQELFRHKPDHLFIQTLDIGTTIALLIYFWPRIKKIAWQITRENDYRLARNILITCLPAGVLGLVLANLIENSPLLLNPAMVAAMLGIVGVLMIVTEWLPHLSPQKDGQALSWRRALVIGSAQAFALIPGVSRSGSTIIASRFMGLSAARAAEYSFMVAIPIMVGLISKLFIKPSDRTYILSHLEPVLLGNIAAFISGFIAIRFMLRYLERHSLAVFGWYRVIISLAVLGFLWYNG
jgi:undecaprenyl-diphosphatase